MIFERSDRARRPLQRVAAAASAGVLVLGVGACSSVANGAGGNGGASPWSVSQSSGTPRASETALPPLCAPHLLKQTVMESFVSKVAIGTPYTNALRILSTITDSNPDLLKRLDGDVDASLISNHGGGSEMQIVVFGPEDNELKTDIANFTGRLGITAVDDTGETSIHDNVTGKNVPPDFGPGAYLASTNYGLDCNAQFYPNNEGA